VLLTLGLGAFGWLAPTPREPVTTAAGLALLVAVAVLQIILIRRDQTEAAKKRYVGRL
jgi:hypothetical protein